MLHVDIPTLPELRTLAAARGDICASLFLPTTPLTQNTTADRIALKNLVQGLVREPDAKGFDKRRAAALEEQLADLVDDDEFWRFQARSLAVLATPDSVRSYRLPNRLSAGRRDRRALPPQAAVARGDLPARGVRARPVSERGPCGRDLLGSAARHGRGGRPPTRCRERDAPGISAGSFAERPHPGLGGTEDPAQAVCAAGRRRFADVPRRP
jgi:hypothetical protein